MTPDNLRREGALKWLRQADKDRSAARALLEVEPSRSVFHSQQAAEGYQGVSHIPPGRLQEDA